MEANEKYHMKIALETEMDSEPCRAPGSCMRMLHWLDNFDKYYSRQLQEMTSLPVELCLIIPAHCFNRVYATSGIILSLFVGALRYEVLLQEMGFRAVGHEITVVEQFRYGAVFMIYYGLSLLAMVTSTQILKYSIKRARPKSLSFTKRMNNLRKAEEGTYSMPSGDSSAAALFCFEYCYMMGLPAVYLLLPLVMCGRVYY